MSKSIDALVVVHVRNTWMDVLTTVIATVIAFHYDRFHYDLFHYDPSITIAFHYNCRHKCCNCVSEHVHIQHPTVCSTSVLYQ